MRTATCLLIALALLPATARADITWPDIIGETGWADHATKDHDVAGTVQVRQAMVDGVQCWQAIANVDVDPRFMLEVARDIEGTPQWAVTADVSDAKILARSGPALEYYQVVDVPGWTMAKDRFWFVRGRTILSGVTIAFAWEKLDNGGAHTAVYEQFLADNPKAIEPPINAGGWLFTPVDDGIEIRYHICTDAGGSVPDNLQSFATSSTLPDTVGDLVREARKRAD